MNQPATDTAAVFTRIYRNEEWRCGDTLSGDGSTKQSTARLRRLLSHVLRGLEVSTLLDVPCGDLNWMRPADLPLERYLGMDIVPEAVERARRRSGGFGEFRVADVTRDALPRVDLVFCRDCLGHLPHELALAALRNIQASGSRYLMATTFYALNQNFERETGDWRPLNLQLPPYSLPPPLLIVPELESSERSIGFDKSMGVWRLAGLSVPSQTHEAHG